MPIIADRDRARFVLTGPDIAPPDLGHYVTADRRAYWREVAVLARDEKYRELSMGLDVNGHRMLPRIRPRRDRATGPVLVPHYSDSRFRTTLRWGATESAAVLWWLASWSRVVAGHARGIRTRRGRVVRDVVGLAPNSIHRVVEKSHRWWARRVARARLAELAAVVGPLPIVMSTPSRRELPSGPSATPHRITPRPMLPPPAFDRPLPAWALSRDWLDLMERSARGLTTAAEIGRLAVRVGITQGTSEIRETLYRLGIDRPPLERQAAIDLMKRLALDRLRSGRMPPPIRTAPSGWAALAMPRVVSVNRDSPEHVIVVIRTPDGRRVRRVVGAGMTLLGLAFGAWAIYAAMTGGLPDIWPLPDPMGVDELGSDIDAAW